MRPALLPSFAKLYRIIHQDFRAGDKLKIVIANSKPAAYLVGFIVARPDYPVTGFNGRKMLTIQTRTWLGGRQGASTIAIAACCLSAMCLLTVAIICIDKRRRFNRASTQISDTDSSYQLLINEGPSDEKR